MANRGLGTLTLSLIAQIGGFVDGMTKAEREMDRRSKAIGAKAEKLGKGIGIAMAAGATAATAALVDWTRDTAQLAGEIEKLSRISGAGFTEFQRQAAAARSVGIENEKLADIFKDVQDRVGEFLQVQGGPMKDFFDEIAAKAGVTAEQFRNLSGPQALQLYVDSLERAGVNQQEMTFYLEAMASDASALIPLLRDNGRGMKDLGDQAQALGGVLDDEAIRASKELKAEVWQLEQQFQGIKTEIGQEVIPIVRDLARSLNDKEFRDGFKSLATGFAETISWAVKAAGEIGKATSALREYFGENSRKSTVGLQNRRDELWLDTSKLQAQQARGGGLFGGAADPVSKLLGLPSDLAEKIKANQREIAEIDQVLSRRATEEMVAQAMRDSRSLWSTGTGRSGTGKPTGKPAKAATGRSGKSDAQREAEEAMRAAQALADAQEAFHSQLLDLQADMAGPVAAVNRDFERQLSDLNAQFAEGKVMLADYAAAQDLFAEKRDRDLKAITDQLGPAEQLIADLKFELDLLAMTNDEREREIALRQAGAAATDEQRKQIVALSDAVRQAREVDQMWGDLQRTLGDTFADLALNIGDAKNIVKDFFDDMAQQIVRFIAQQWAKKLVDSMQTSSSAGGGGGGWMDLFGKALGALFSTGGTAGARANGGPVGAGLLYQVNERGPELLSVGGRDFLMMGANAGRVTPNHMLGRGGGSTINQTFVVQGSPDRRTRAQMARDTGRAASRAITRNG